MVIASIELSKNEEKMMPNSQNYEKLRNRYLDFQFEKIAHFPLKNQTFCQIRMTFSQLKDGTALSAIILKYSYLFSLT